MRVFLMALRLIFTLASPAVPQGWADLETPQSAFDAAVIAPAACQPDASAFDLLHPCAA